MISAMRIKWPSKCILIVKTDLDAAYQSVHENMQIASTCISIVVKVAFLFLRLHLGTTPAPEKYTTLGNYLLADASWDATNVQSPHRHLLPRYYYLPTSELLVKADQLAVNIEAKEALMDGFIDYIITITIDNPFWMDHAKNVALLVIHTIFRPLQPY